MSVKKTSWYVPACGFYYGQMESYYAQRDMNVTIIRLDANFIMSGSGWKTA